jgi:hypothetical protein
VERTLALHDIIEERFSVRCNLDEAAITVRLEGHAERDMTPTLTRFLENLHAEARELSLESVTLDLTALSLMNAACTQAFVSWAVALAEQPAPYRTEVLINEASRWQERTFDTIRRMSDGAIEVNAVSA